MSIHQVLDLKSDVHLVRILGRYEDGAMVDHITVVDPRTNLIWECVEKHPLELCMEFLSCCVGDGSIIIDVKEIRRVVLEDTKNGDSGALKRERDF